jgi:hypothetical protein
MSQSFDYYLKAFSKISDFVTELTSVYGDSFHELKLYNRLLEKTKISHKQSIKDHVNAFTEFCLKNKDGILEKDVSKLTMSKVSFSDKVYIDIVAVINATEKEDREVVWNHILAIHSQIDPTSGARELLKKSIQNKSAEGNFINNFLNTVENSVNKDEAAKDPMKAASSILNSGVLSELVGGLNNGVTEGSLDLGKLIGSVQGMLGSLTSQLNGADAPTDGNGQQFDLSGMMGMVTNMMGGLGNLSQGAQGSGDSDNPLAAIGGLLGGGKPDVKSLMAEVDAEMAKSRAPPASTSTDSSSQSSTSSSSETTTSSASSSSL